MKRLSSLSRGFQFNEEAMSTERKRMRYGTIIGHRGSADFSPSFTNLDDNMGVSPGTAGVNVARVRAAVANNNKGSSNAKRVVSTVTGNTQTRFIGHRRSNS